MEDQSRSIIIRAVCAALIPFMQLFAIYVIIHGHYGPGGGFQGGVILAVSVMLQRVYMGTERAHGRFPPRLAPALAGIGMVLYMLVGFLPLFSGGNFLDFGHLPIPGVHGAELRSLGILIVESAIGLAVFGTLVLIFDTIAGEKW